MSIVAWMPKPAASGTGVARRDEGVTIVANYTIRAAARTPDIARLEGSLPAETVQETRLSNDRCGRHGAHAQDAVIACCPRANTDWCILKITARCNHLTRDEVV